MKRRNVRVHACTSVHHHLSRLSIWALTLLLALASMLSIAPTPAYAEGPTYEYLRTLGINNYFFYVPKGVAVASDGTVFVADTDNHRIQVFQSDGTFVRMWGSQGSNNGEFNKPCGIAVTSDGSTLVVADTYNHRIQLFAKQQDGSYAYHAKIEKSGGGSGTGDGEFNYPQGVAVTGDGSTLVVADTTNHRIQLFTKQPDGSYAYDAKIGKSGGGAGTGDGEFNYSAGIAVTSDGSTLFVADAFNHRIQLFAKQQDGSYAYDAKIGKSGGGAVPAMASSLLHKVSRWRAMAARSLLQIQATTASSSLPSSRIAPTPTTRRLGQTATATASSISQSVSR